MHQQLGYRRFLRVTLRKAGEIVKFYFHSQMCIEYLLFLKALDCGNKRINAIAVLFLKKKKGRRK